MCCISTDVKGWHEGNWLRTEDHSATLFVFSHISCRYHVEQLIPLLCPMGNLKIVTYLLLWSSLYACPSGGLVTQMPTWFNRCFLQTSWPRRQRCLYQAMVVFHLPLQHCQSLQFQVRCSSNRFKDETGVETRTLNLMFSFGKAREFDSQIPKTTRKEKRADDSNLKK